MKIKYYVAAVTLIFAFTAGCSHYRALDKEYGSSYNMAKQGQILNPGASKNPEPVTGLNGNAAGANEEKYIQSFSKGSGSQASKSFVVPIIPAGTAGMGQDVYGK